MCAHCVEEAAGEKGRRPWAELLAANIEAHAPRQFRAKNLARALIWETSGDHDTLVALVRVVQQYLPVLRHAATRGGRRELSP